MPLSSADVPFVFNEMTRDFQAVTLQGHLTYRVAEPKRLAGLLDYSVNASGAYTSEDRSQSERRAAEARAYALEKTLAPVRAPPCTRRLSW